MSYENKSLDEFLDHLHTIDPIPSKLAKIDERLMELEEKIKEDEDLLKNIHDRTYRRNEEIAQLRGIRQTVLQSQSSSSSSVQVHPTGLRELELFPSSVSHFVRRPPHSSDHHRRSRLGDMLSTTSSSSPSPFHPPDSSNRPLFGSLSASPSSTRPRLGNISPVPLSSSPLNPFLYPHPQGPNPRLQILQDPLPLPLPNPNQHPLPRPRVPRIRWEGRLQQVFDESVASLWGLTEATANDIHELMQAEGLTNKQIQNRLQVMKRGRDPADDSN